MNRADFYIYLLVMMLALAISPWLEIVICIPYTWYLMGKSIDK